MDTVVEEFSRARARYGWTRDDLASIRGRVVEWPVLLETSTGGGRTGLEGETGSRFVSSADDSSMLSQQSSSSSFDDEEEPLTAQLDILDLDDGNTSSTLEQDTTSKEGSPSTQTLHEASRSFSVSNDTSLNLKSPTLATKAIYNPSSPSLSSSVSDQLPQQRMRRAILEDDSFEERSSSATGSSPLSTVLPHNPENRSNRDHTQARRDMWNSIEQLLDSSVESKDASEYSSDADSFSGPCSTYLTSDSEDIVPTSTNSSRSLGKIGWCKENNYFSDDTDAKESINESAGSFDNDGEHQDRADTSKARDTEESISQNEDDEDGSFEVSVETESSFDAFEDEFQEDISSGSERDEPIIDTNRKSKKALSWERMTFKELCSDKTLLNGKAFAHVREKLAQRIFTMLNAELNSALPDDLKLEWSRKLNTTAGRTRYLRKQSNGITERSAVIELGIKVLDDSRRLTFTLAHEMCHAAVWILDAEAADGPHGKRWKTWTKKLTSCVRCVKISTRHDYDINFKYVYNCTAPNCASQWGRHSKSIDVSRQRCGKCGSAIVLRASSDGRKPTAFNSFTKAHFASVQEKNPSWTFGQVSKHVAAMYRQQQQ